MAGSHRRSHRPPPDTRDADTPNLEGARREGFNALQFSNAGQLRKDLAALGLPLYTRSCRAVVHL